MLKKRSGPVHWKQNPATKNRVVDIQHTATGHYLVRFPALASARGVAHVTVNGNSLGISCVVRDSRDDGPDHLVDVACYYPDDRTHNGEPADTQFTVLFTEPKSRVATVDTASGLRSGAPISVRPLGVGEYEVTVEGFSATGYAQITPRGPDAVRCRTIGARIVVRCATIVGNHPVDAAWTLSYADRTTPAPFAPGAYVRTTDEGLAIDDARSYNSAGGAMKVQWQTPAVTGSGSRAWAPSATPPRSPSPTRVPATATARTGSPPPCRTARCGSMSIATTPTGCMRTATSV